MNVKRVKLFSGARKSARATAAITPGIGRVRINGTPAEMIVPEIARERIMIPLELAGEQASKVDINVKVKGGGVHGQAEASAIAIAKALVGYSRGEETRKRIIAFDRHLLSGDPRRTESKKFGGPGARTRKQKSYR